MTSQSTFWQCVGADRAFLIPDGFVFSPGSLHIHDRLGRDERVDPRCIEEFEISSEQARRLAADQLGEVLGELRQGITERLGELRRELADARRNEISSDTAPALLDFLKALPGVIGQSLSGDEQRIGAARDTMTRLQHRLRESGFEVDDRVKNFAERLASIRTDAAADRRADEAHAPAEDGKPDRDS